MVMAMVVMCMKIMIKNEIQEGGYSMIHNTIYGASCIEIIYIRYEESYYIIEMLSY
jgi:hypothetical protein